MSRRCLDASRASRIAKTYQKLGKGLNTIFFLYNFPINRINYCRELWFVSPRSSFKLQSQIISATVPLGTQWSVHRAQRWLAGSVNLGLDWLGLWTWAWILDLELVLVLFLKGSQGVALGRSRALTILLGGPVFMFCF